MGVWNFRKSYQSMYQNVMEAKFMFYDRKLSKSSEFYYRDPGLYPSNTDIVEAMNTLFKKDTITANIALQLKCF